MIQAQMISRSLLSPDKIPLYIKRNTDTILINLFIRCARTSSEKSETMSNYPHGPPPPYGWPPPPHHYPSHMYPPPPDGGQVTAPAPYPYYVPGAVMVPVPMAPMPVPPPSDPAPQPTYITNYIYHGDNTNQPRAIEGTLPEFGDYDWVPTTATTAAHLSGSAVVGGREGWDGSPLWVIRAWHNDDLVPGKFSIRHNSASIPHSSKEIHVQNIEVLIAKAENLRWIPASNGNIPPGAIEGGRTAGGETLYVGRANYQLSITPGKIHPTHNCCYIPFSGNEVSQRMYDVLCKI